ncbi:MAG: NADH-quinone oxidoreductase subunit C [Clostridiaceae bacterium]
MENVYEITREQLMGTTQDMMYNGYRFVTATCVDNGNGSFDVLYHFDRDLEIITFRVTLNREEEVPSISKIYFCAALVENEMKELFGLKVTNIVIDYEGHLLLSDGAPENPMARQQITIVRKEG